MNVFRKKSVEQTLAETGESGHALKRDLTWWDLAIMGVAVAVRAGIFSIGAQAAAFHAGPAVVLSFLIAGVVCGAAVMCYAEFASMIPVAGSAYTFTYTTVGEIVAWVIGWDLILEMLMAGSVVSKYWGVYLNQFFELIGWNINTNIAIGSFNFDLAPVIIVAFFTALLVMGTKIGARVDGALTILKIAIVVFIVVVGFFYIKAENFTPFIPPSEPAASTDGSGVSAVMEQPLWQWATGMAPSIYGVTGIISGAAIEGLDLNHATEEDWDTEYLALKMGIKVVSDLDAAIDHINTHSTGHTESIIAEDYAAIEEFTKRIDSAVVMVNASTRFTDGGVFGFGAELGISTQKMHARGPMGLREMTTTKWIGYGTGQVRA